MASLLTNVCLRTRCKTQFPRLVINGSLLKVKSISTKAFPACHQRVLRSDIPLATYGGRHTVTLIPADGIGPQMIEGIERVFRSAGVPIDFEEMNVSNDDKQGNDTFDDILTSIQRNGVALKGNWITKTDLPNETSLNVALRHQLELYANVVHCKSYPTVTTRHQNVDFVIIRENTEGEYSHLEHENVPGVIEMMKIITREKSERIARFAFDYAVNHERRKVTAIHKANIMKMSDGLFLQTCREISNEYPDIEFSDMIVDNCSMQLVSKPEQFDVMVMPNLYGNVITNIGAALVGGPGIPWGENYGKNYGVFESGTRNTGKGIADANIANPMSMIFASTAMLRYLELSQHAKLIDSSIHDVVVDNKARTSDIGGMSSTSEFLDVVCEHIERRRARRKDAR